MNNTKKGKIGKLSVERLANEDQLGQRAAQLVAAQISELLLQQEEVNIIFAAAASQDAFLAGFSKAPLPWERINAFHMDEYIGLSQGSDKSFGYFLGKRIFDKVPFKQVFLLQSDAADKEDECARYTALLQAHLPDIVCMGIGENTHLAFNDPHVADFDDPHWVKVVDIDVKSRQQQVNEGWFPNIDEVPTLAYTLTIPTLLRARYAFCLVPGHRKADAVLKTFTEAIGEQHPSTILRQTAQAVLLLDPDSARLVEDFLQERATIETD